MAWLSSAFLPPSLDVVISRALLSLISAIEKSDFQNGTLKWGKSIIKEVILYNIDLEFKVFYKVKCVYQKDTLHMCHFYLVLGSQLYV